MSLARATTISVSIARPPADVEATLVQAVGSSDEDHQRDLGLVRADLERLERTLEGDD